MSWGNEDDVDKIVRQLLKPIRVRHKNEVKKLKEKIAVLEEALTVLQEKQ
jgi:DNA-binding Xre family transcriptional regulator